MKVHLEGIEEARYRRGTRTYTDRETFAKIPIFVQPGDPVEERQLLLVIEAMKMEQQIRAGIAGKVVAIHAKAGDQVRTGQLLAELTEN